MSKELVVIGKQDIAKVFQKDGMNPFIEKIKEVVKDAPKNADTLDNRKILKSLSYKVRQSKTYLDKHGKELVAGVKAQVKEIDIERKRMRDILDALAASLREPLTAWENAEKERVDSLRNRVEKIANYRVEDYSDWTSTRLVSLTNKLRQHEPGEDFQEFQEETVNEYKQALIVIGSALEIAVRREDLEKKERELEEEKKKRDQEERERKLKEEAATQARLEAECKAQKERDMAKRAEYEAEERARKAELEAEEAKEREQRAIDASKIKEELAAKTERQKIADEEEIRRAQDAKRIANQEYRDRVINDAITDIADNTGMTRFGAKKIINLILQGTIRNTEIRF